MTCTSPVSRTRERNGAFRVRGGTSPRWRGDGKELFYLALDNRLVSVPINAAQTFEFGTPTALFRIDTTRSGYDVSADGQRFLVSTGTPQGQSLPFAVVLNWTADLKH